MLFAPTALILADNAQRNLLNSARLDGPTTAPAAQRTTRIIPIRRSLRFLVLQTRPAVGFTSEIADRQLNSRQISHRVMCCGSVNLRRVRKGFRWRESWSPVPPRVWAEPRQRNS